MGLGLDGLKEISVPSLGMMKILYLKRSNNIIIILIPIYIYHIFVLYIYLIYESYIIKY